MRSSGFALLFATGVLVAAAAACGTDSEDMASSSGRGAAGGNAGPGAGGSINGAPQGGGGGTPPERESEASYRVPVVSGRWVWTANPDTGRIAVIDAESFSTRTVYAGLEPTYLTGLPVSGEGESAALVINVGSQDAHLLIAEEGGAVQASPAIPLHAGANSWAVREQGDFAIAWTDAAAELNPDPTEGYQDLTVLDLRDRTAIGSRRLTVGFRPSRVFLDADDARAYVVTEPGITVIELDAAGGPRVDRDVLLSDDPANDTAPREVVMTPDGELALVRREGSEKITVVTVASGDRVEVELGGPVTDLDLTADGGLAVAVVRTPGSGTGGGTGGAPQGGASGTGGDGQGGVFAGGADNGDGTSGAGGDGSDAAGGAAGGDPGAQKGSLVALLPLPDIAAQPGSYRTLVIDEVFGSVSLAPDAVRAVLYTNAIASSRLTVLDTSGVVGPSSYRTVDVQIPIHAVLPTPNGDHAIALLRPPPDAVRPGAFAVVPVSSALPAKIQGTVAPTAPSTPSGPAPAYVALSDERAVVTVSDGLEVHAAYLVRMPENIVDRITLASEPLPGASGIVPAANKAFVAQRHPEGRITFIDLTTGKERTMTGFELGATVNRD